VMVLVTPSPKAPRLLDPADSHRQPGGVKPPFLTCETLQLERFHMLKLETVVR